MSGLSYLSASLAPRAILPYPLPHSWAMWSYLQLPEYTVLCPPLCLGCSLGRNASPPFDEFLLFFSLGGFPQRSGPDKMTILSVSSSTHSSPESTQTTGFSPLQPLSWWRVEPVSSHPWRSTLAWRLVYSRCSVSAGEWMLWEVEGPGRGSDGHAFVLPLVFLFFAQVCLLRKLTKLAIWSRLHEGEASLYCLMLSPLPFKFGHLFRCLWNIPIINLKLALCIKNCYFTQGLWYQKMIQGPDPLQTAYRCSLQLCDSRGWSFMQAPQEWEI